MTTKRRIEAKGIGWTKWVQRGALRYRLLGQASLRVGWAYLVRQVGVIYSVVGIRERHR